MKMNLRELVKQQATGYPDNIYLYWEDETVTYAQLLEITNKIANIMKINKKYLQPCKWPGTF